MSSSRQGRASPLTAALATGLAILPTTNPHQLSYYSETFQATEGFVNDQVIEHGAATGRDMTLPSPALKRGTGSITAPMDLSQLDYWLRLLCGPPTTEVEDNGVSPSRWTRTFTSGGIGQLYSAFSLPVTDDLWKVIHNAALNTMGFSTSKIDGYRQMELGFLTPGVYRSLVEPAFSAAGSPVTYLDKRVTGELGTFSIGGVALATIIDNNFSFSNQAELLDLADGSPLSLGYEANDTLIRSDMTLRVLPGVAVNDVLSNFQGAEGAPFAAQYNFTIDANASLVIDMPNCVGERRLPVIGGANRQTFQAPIQAFQNGGSPAATFTLINQVA